MRDKQNINPNYVGTMFNVEIFNKIVFRIRKRVRRNKE